MSLRSRFNLEQGLHRKIDEWSKEVVRQTTTTQRRKASEQATEDRGSYGMKLRSSGKRPPLAETSANPRKRKRPVIMPGDSTADDDKQRRKGSGIAERQKRGRPLGSKNKIPTGDLDPQQNVISHPPPSSKASDPTSLNNAPSVSLSIGATPSRKQSTKRGQKTLDKSKSEASIDMPYLATCTPSVRQTDFQTLIQSGQNLPTSVRSLQDTLDDVPLGVIPSQLKPSYEQELNTPRKSRHALRDTDYLPADASPYPQAYLSRLHSTVGLVQRKAAKSRRKHAHEKQWGAVASLLLSEVELWDDALELMNIEICSIQPIDIRPERPNNAGYIDDDTPSTSNPANSPENIGRMVDWCLSLSLDWAAEATIQDAYHRLRDHEHSLNQSLSYIKDQPLILDIEIKKTLASRDPEVQLAIWASGALKKRQLHGWDLKPMPTPAIVVNRHEWQYYLFFSTEKDKLIMAGPYRFGSTDSLLGIWTILYRLRVIATWATTEYSVWFREHVLMRKTLAHNK